MSGTNDGSFGQQELSTPNTEFNIQQFLIKQAIGRMNTATLVRVETVRAPVGVAPVGFVDVTPLVNQIDGANQAVPHTRVFNLPYVRIQGGANAVIVDPQPGDIGICVFAQADISSVKASKDVSNPGSKRRFDMADGMYIGGALNTTPERYVMIDDNGITIEGVATVTIHGDNTTINADNATVNADQTTVNGNATVNGNVNVNGNISATGTVTGETDVIFAGFSAVSHVHIGGTFPTGKTGEPV